MLVYIILCIALLYTIVAYYLCLTSEMPAPPDWKEEKVGSPLQQMHDISAKANKTSAFK